MIRATPGPPQRGGYHDPICCLGAAQLARQIAGGQLTAEQVVSAHIAQIGRVNPRINALSVPLFDQARLAARHADDVLRSGAPLGPLHGVPFTVKDSFHVLGTRSQIGIANLSYPVATADSVLVAGLKRAGAVLLGKTNVPQLMLWHECDNPIYGRTNNPCDEHRTPGGSTGGEAALIAACGSPLGLGSELGGSIVVPAHFCGICGLKPTAGRLTRTGTRQNFAGMEAMKVSAGPLARRVEDVALAFRVLLGASRELDPADTSPVALAESGDVRIEGLRIAVWASSHYFPASPAIRRAVAEAAGCLERQGAIVSTFEPPDLAHALALYFGLLSADGGRNFRRLLKGSVVDRRVRRIVRGSHLSRPVRAMMVWLLDKTGNRRLARMLSWSGRRSAGEYLDLCRARQEYENQFMQEFDRLQYDAMLCPAYALPAIPHGRAVDLMPAACYSFLTNLLGLPTGVVPVTRVQKGEESDRAILDRGDAFAIAAEAGTVGLPVGVHVVARHWREDVVLAVMAAIERRTPV
ncbi:MAG TPA: amidase family protein [Pirellulales bacterium]|jgi:fatty acid amide hydrolase|nr:amidase family protein [Pirellulales bacterium]